MNENQDLKEGHTLNNGKYTIIQSIGKGGFSNTYLAYDNTNEANACKNIVVLKEFFLHRYCYRASDSFKVMTRDIKKAQLYVKLGRHKFRGEIQKLRAISSPNIIKVYDQFEENDTLYYVMEYIEGGSLEDLIHLNGPLDEYKAKVFINKIGSALKEMHAHHMLHLDVKPSNILLRDSNDVVLCDFGAAKLYNRDGRACTRTPYITSGGFSAPEQYLSMELQEFTPTTDVYGLGATLLFLITGRVPNIKENWMLERFNLPIRLAIMNSITFRSKRIRTVDDFLDVLNGKLEFSTVKSKIKPNKKLYDESGFF